MKKFLSILFAFLVLVPCTYVLTACGGNKTEKVMNVDLNPSLEFVLDKNDKVVTVNALNDDGNHIISIATKSETLFEGLTAEQAVELFLQITKDNGYLITGDEETMKISISGDAKDLLNAVKSTANTYLNNLNINVKVDTASIKKDEIVAEVEKCMQEYSKTDLNKMTEEELVALLKKSRQETKDFLTQELKETYYALRGEEIRTAKLEAIYAKVKDLTNLADIPSVSIFKTNMSELTTKFTEFKNSFVENLLSEESEYSQKMQAYITAKEELLNLRLNVSADGEITVDEQSALVLKEAAVTAAQNALTVVKQEAENAINYLNTLLDGAITAAEGVMDMVTAFLSNVDLESVNTAVQNVKDNFSVEFSSTDSTFSVYVEAGSYWANVEIGVEA